MIDMFRVTEVELVYRNKQKATDRPEILTSEAAYKLLLQSWDENKIELQEQFKVLLLDRRHSCIGISTIATGGITLCAVDKRLIYALALKARATGFILAHNHPSGNLQPSSEDKNLTSNVASGARQLDLSVPDHVIVAKHGYYSFADNGLMPG